MLLKNKPLLYKSVLSVDIFISNDDEYIFNSNVLAQNFYNRIMFDLIGSA